AFAAAAPLLGAAIALRLPDAFVPSREPAGPLIVRESVRPGAALALASVGYATVAAFVVLHLESRGVGHGATVFAAFAAMVVLARLVLGGLPDRLGPARVAIASTLLEAAGLLIIGLAHSLLVAILGGCAMGIGFS